MPTSCVAINCTQRRSAESAKAGITFHSFPKDPEKCTAWVRSMRRIGIDGKPWKPSSSSMLCSKHFKPEMFDRTGQTVRLREHAIPTEFDFPAHLKAKATAVRREISRPEPAKSDSGQSTAPVADLMLVEKEHQYHLPPADVLKRKLDAFEASREDLSKKLRNAVDRERRAKATCRNVTEKLSSLHLVTEELRLKLDSYADFPVDLFAKPVEGYSTAQKEFALTLHLYSAKAYQYLRDTMKLQLPHPRTLSRWLQSVDSNPGLNIAVLDALQHKKQQNPEFYTRCGMQLDGMSIRRQVSYCAHSGRMCGFVDLGNGEETSEEAKEVLVFMLVGITGHWKAPIAYFFTNTLTAAVQKELVLLALNELHDRGFDVVTLTMDGHASNVTMCRLLGCSFEVSCVQSWFVLPDTGRRIYVIFDACHMLKLIRNMLATYEIILSPSGRVCWAYVKDLHSLQEESGLRLANKLSSRHLDFTKHKMKVSLAAQTLSCSVAKALRAMKEMGFSQFVDVVPTAEFIEMIDHLFDVMNSRNPHARGYKAPINRSNVNRTISFLLSCRQQLISLQTLDKNFLYTSKRQDKLMVKNLTLVHLCIIGFIVNIDSMVALASELLQYQSYILTYKFSQDHLELFFNAVRRAGGWNNNPSALHFQSVFRRLLIRCGVQPGCTGNVVSLDETSFVGCDAAEITLADDQPSPFTDIDSLHGVIHDHEYSSSVLNSLVENTVVYISGWVVRKLMKSLQCDTCRSALVNDTIPHDFRDSFHLLELKNNGGLVIPSAGCVKVVMIAEKTVRQALNLHRASNKLTTKHLLSRVLGAIGSQDIFCLGEHIGDTRDGIDNHHYQLLRMILTVYLNLRQHHIAKLHTLQLQKSSIRQVLTKTILFKGQ